MKFHKVYFSCWILFFSLLLSCGEKDDYIPPAIKPHEPGTPDTTEIFNELGFVPHKEGEPFDSYQGLVMTGYQGWFCAPGSGCSHSNHKNTEWYHYRENEMFEPGVLKNSIDFWPDMTEYEKQYTPGKFIYPDGNRATVYSAYDKSSVMLHFKWMRDYGIDGAFMQRFVGEVIDNPAGKDHFDKVLESAMEASNTHQRAICVMYDLGGFVPGRLSATLEDAQSIMEKYQLKDRTQQRFYLYQNEKPLIVLWGVGFNDGRPFSLSDVEVLMKGLKEKGFSIMLGVPTYWRERKNDALSDPKLHELIKEADVIMPWFVGRFDNGSYPQFHDLIEEDIEWCENNSVEYAPLCFPGLSDRNMYPNNKVVPRHGGQFYWNQIYQNIKSGAKMLYIAIFDEIDEGTAIFKTMNRSTVPGNESENDYWVLFSDGRYSIVNQEVSGLSGDDWCKRASDLDVIFQGIDDDLPTDHYLWLTGQGRKMLRGEIPLSKSIPLRN